jgi:hypothetical protein
MALGGRCLVGRLSQQELALEAVQLGLLNSVTVLLGESEPLVKRHVSLAKPCGSRVGVAEEAELEGAEDLGAGGPEAVEAFLEQGERFVRPTLQQQSGTFEECSRGGPEGKTLFGRDRDLFRGGGFYFVPQPAELVQPGGVVQAVSDAERVADLGQFSITRWFAMRAVGRLQAVAGHRWKGAHVVGR